MPVSFNFSLQPIKSVLIKVPASESASQPRYNPQLFFQKLPSESELNWYSPASAHDTDCNTANLDVGECFDWLEATKKRADNLMPITHMLVSLEY